MKTVLKFFVIIAVIAMCTCCHSNPHNTFGGPSDHPKDTAAVKRDTSSTGTRVDR